MPATTRRTPVQEDLEARQLAQALAMSEKSSARKSTPKKITSKSKTPPPKKRATPSSPTPTPSSPHSRSRSRVRDEERQLAEAIEASRKDVVPRTKTRSRSRTSPSSRSRSRSNSKSKSKSKSSRSSKPHSRYPPQPSFPPLGSSLDILDKKLSTYIFKIELKSKLLEFLLSVVGHQHGIPITAMCLHCLSLGAANDYFNHGYKLSSPTVASAIFLTIVQVVCWAAKVSDNKHEDFYLVGKGMLIVCLLFCNAMVNVFGAERSACISAWYYVSYLATQAVVVALKIACTRMRPAHALEEKVKNFRRELPRLTFRNVSFHMTSSTQLKF